MLTVNKDCAEYFIKKFNALMFKHDIFAVKAYLNKKGIPVLTCKDNTNSRVDFVLPETFYLSKGDRYFESWNEFQNFEFNHDVNSEDGFYCAQNSDAIYIVHPSWTYCISKGKYLRITPTSIDFLNHRNNIILKTKLGDQL